MPGLNQIRHERFSKFLGKRFPDSGLFQNLGKPFFPSGGVCKVINDNGIVELFEEFKHKVERSGIIVPVIHILLHGVVVCQGLELFVVHHLSGGNVRLLDVCEKLFSHFSRDPVGIRLLAILKEHHE